MRRTALVRALACAVWWLGVSGTAYAQAIDAPRHLATVYVVRRGWHMDVGFAVADLSPRLQSIAANFPRANYLFFGFGDKHYLLAPKHGAFNLLAALWPGAGMLLVTGVEVSPQDAFDPQYVVALTEATDAAAATQDFIEQSLLSREAVVQPYGAGPYPGSLYFASSKKYSAVYTCNTWAAQALRRGNKKIHSGGVLFAGQLWTQVRQPGAAVEPRPSY